MVGGRRGGGRSCALSPRGVLRSLLALVAVLAHFGQPVGSPVLDPLAALRATPSTPDLPRSVLLRDASAQPQAPLPGLLSLPQGGQGAAPLIGGLERLLRDPDVARSVNLVLQRSGNSAAASTLQRLLATPPANPDSVEDTSGEEHNAVDRRGGGMSGAQPLPPAFPLRPAAPAKPIIDQMAAGFDAVATLMALNVLMPMLMNPAVVMQFQSPKLMTQNPPVLPASFREPAGDRPEYFHPYGNWGDYGYEAMGYRSYGTASGGCAPWWWQWTRRNNQFAPFSKTSLAMD